MISKTPEQKAYALYQETFKDWDYPPELVISNRMSQIVEEVLAHIDRQKREDIIRRFNDSTEEELDWRRAKILLTKYVQNKWKITTTEFKILVPKACKSNNSSFKKQLFEDYLKKEEYMTDVDSDIYNEYLKKLEEDVHTSPSLLAQLKRAIEDGYYDTHPTAFGQFIMIFIMISRTLMCDLVFITLCIVLFFTLVNITEFLFSL